MCGLFGMIFHSEAHVKEKESAQTLFSFLAFTAASRGEDAVGMGIVRREGHSDVFHSLKPSHQVVVEDVEWSKRMEGLATPACGIIGHTRWKTHGRNVMENVHPFEFLHGETPFLGAHNGMIANHERFGPRLPYHNDSRNLFFGLAHERVDRWIPFLERVEGSYALSWAMNGHVFLARNSGSPCVFAYSALLDATIWASTPMILERSAKGAGIVLRDLRVLPVGVLHQWEPYKRVPTVRRFTPKQVPVARVHMVQCSGCRKRFPVPGPMPIHLRHTDMTFWCEPCSLVSSSRKGL